MIYATRALHKVEDAPFLLYCDSFVRAIHRLDKVTLSLRIDGHETTRVRLALLPSRRNAKRIAPRLWSAKQEAMDIRWADGRYEAWVPANVALVLSWEA